MCFYFLIFYVVSKDAKWRFVVSALFAEDVDETVPEQNGCEVLNWIAERGAVTS